MKSTTLYFKEGSADKVYQATIEPKGAGFVVNYVFGRRGSTLNTVVALRPESFPLNPTLDFSWLEGGAQT